ncbi:MAG TPA: formyltransferase family protein [Burkholderiales bacterium]|nr:formyltransferase family protein [Burkholderiales bacterium]
MRVALVCEESAGARVLENLARDAHEIVALVTSPHSPAWNLGVKLGVRPLAARRVREPDFADVLASCGAQLLLNIHSLYIVPQPALRAPPLGAYNLHPGPLPGCAGLNAPSWAIYRGEPRHGVTVHRMEAGIDTGPIAFQDWFPLEESDTGLSVALRCARRGVELVRKLVQILARDPAGLELTPQDLAQRRYFGREVPQGGRIDWNAPARRIYDFVRACDYQPFASPWGTPVAQLGGREVEVQKVALTGERSHAAPGSVRDDNLVATADEWLLLKKWK